MLVELSRSVWGDPAAPPMVLLHALGTERSSWAAVAAEFATTHRVYAPDLRGCGASPWPGEYSFELMRDDVVALLDALDLRGVTLVGHSMGGTVAALLAEEHGDRLARLVLEDTAPPRPGAERRPAPQRPAELPPEVDWPLVEAIIGQLNDPDPAWWDRTTQIAVPTLVVAGGPDSHVPQDQLAELATRVPDGRLVVIPAGHQVHRDRPAEFIAALRAFLS